MDVFQDQHWHVIFLRVGAIALVVELIVFEGTFDLVQNPPLSGSAQFLLRAALLAVAVTLLSGGTYFSWRQR